jgi:hypothetical protein
MNSLISSRFFLEGRKICIWNFLHIQSHEMKTKTAYLLISDLNAYMTFISFPSLAKPCNMNWMSIRLSSAPNLREKKLSPRLMLAIACLWRVFFLSTWGSYYLLLVCWRSFFFFSYEWVLDFYQMLFLPQMIQS